MERISLILAPALMAISTFWWRGGEYTPAAATLLILSLFFWLAAFKRLFALIASALPRYSGIGLWVAYGGCISGCCFAFLGYITAVLNISHVEYLQALGHYPFSSQLLLFASGPLFPLSIILYGIQAMRVRVMPVGIGILFCVAGIVFPASRITRTEWIAHLADLALLIPCFYIRVKGSASI